MGTCTVQLLIFGKARPGAVYIRKLLTFFTELLLSSCDVLCLMPWELNAQTRVCYQLELGKHLADVSTKTFASYFSEQKLHLIYDQ